ncbi:uncharacterized protein LOC122650773 [Telopea speciosissima]|uniref:uncharacterized protein LOC122650773 n=1 Tax=Telopea speciosissima TaxID=54955 RepID=UPI001CC76817|nr:uncharacterized protein LOC122650773 [Telopea speciosissima]
MSDLWTDMKDHSFINVIAYSPKGAVFLNSFECSDSSKTGLFLRDILEPIIEEIGVEKVVQLISDNASNYGVAISLIMEKYPHIHRVTCAAHGVQLLLKDIDARISWVKEVFDKAKLVVGFMYKHGTVLALMRECTGGKELKKPCKTRFAYNFFMLKSILDVEDLLRVMVASAEWRINKNYRSDLGAMVTQIIQSTEFWLNAKDVLSILEPLIIVLRLVDGDGATSPFLYEAMERARNTIIDHCNRDSSKYKRLLQLFDSRKEANIIHPVHMMTAFLNPFFMYDGKFSYYQNDVKQAVIYIIKTMVSADDKRQFANEFRNYYEKEEKLFHELSFLIVDCHPHKFMVDYAWKLCSLASKDSYSHFESTLWFIIMMNNLMKLKSKEIEKFSKDSIVLDKLLEIPINEDGDRVGLEDEGDTMVEDDQTWLDRELGLGSAFNYNEPYTPIYSGNLSQLRTIVTPFIYESETSTIRLRTN